MDGTSGAALEKTNHPEGEHENGAAHRETDDAKDQTYKGDLPATERAGAGLDPPAGDEPHDRRHRTEQKPGEPDKNDREDERQDSYDEGGVSKAVDTRTGACDARALLVTSRRWRRRRVTHGSRVQQHPEWRSLNNQSSD